MRGPPNVVFKLGGFFGEGKRAAFRQVCPFFRCGEGFLSLKSGSGPLSMQGCPLAFNEEWLVDVVAVFQMV